MTSLPCLIKALKYKPSAPYASVVSMKQICTAVTHHCAIIERAPRARWLSRALQVSARALTADQRP